VGIHIALSRLPVRAAKERPGLPPRSQRVRDMRVEKGSDEHHHHHVSREGVAGNCRGSSIRRHVSDEIVETAARFDANSESKRRMLRRKSD